MVLIVDDEPDIAASLQDLVDHDLPYDTLTATTPEEGLAILKSLEMTPPALLIVDYRMPRINGVQFLQRARQMFPGLPAIMVTAYAHLDLVIRAARDLKVSRFLRKPLRAEEVLAAVEDVVSHHWRGLLRQAAFERSVAAQA